MKKTINLLPPRKKEDLKVDALNNFLIRTGVIMIIAIILLAVFLIFNLFVLNFNEKANEIANNQNEKGEINDIIKETKKKIDDQYSITNQSVKEFKKIMPYWDYLNQINQILPESVYYSDIVMKKDFMEIRGLAENRDNLVEFKENLVKNNKFQEIEMPISNFVSRENVNFTIKLKEPFDK